MGLFQERTDGLESQEITSGPSVERKRRGLRTEPCSSPALKELGSREKVAREGPHVQEESGEGAGPWSPRRGPETHSAFRSSEHLPRMVLCGDEGRN